MKKLLCLLIPVSILSAAPLKKSKLGDKIVAAIGKGIKKGQDERRIRHAHERERGNKPKFSSGKKFDLDSYTPELELWYKGHKKRGQSTSGLKPLYYKLGYIQDHAGMRILVTEGEYSSPNFQELKPSDRKSSYLLDQHRWLLISDKENPGPGDTLYKFEFPKSRKMLIRLRLVEPREKPLHTMKLHDKNYFIGAQTGPLKGLKGKTESGIPLIGNIADKDIRPKKLNWDQVLELPIHSSRALYS